jgi:hypothetical protein
MTDFIVYCSFGGKVVIAGARMQLRRQTTSASPFLVVHPLEATMKKILLLCGMLLALSATVASAAGINMAWDACLNGGGVPAKTFACNSNIPSGGGTATTPAHHMFLSAIAPGGIELWTSFEFEFQLQSDDAALPLWWAVRGAGQCRNGALSAAAANATQGCTDVYGAAGAGGIASYTVGFGGANRARSTGVWSVPSFGQTPMNEGEEYFVTRISLSNAKTVGLGACAGCNVGVCINAISVKFVQPAGTPGGNPLVTIPANRAHVLWQNVVDQNTCYGATPAKNVTWGRVKTLYR